MTSEVKEELKLLIDDLTEKASSIEDWEYAEMDEWSAIEKQSEEGKLNQYNQGKLQMARIHLNKAIATIQELVDKND